MSYDPILHARLARERHQEYLREAAQNRLVARAGRLTLARRAARPLGQALMRLGASLLRYGLVEQTAAAGPYHPSVRSIELH